ncbi:MAG TPA: transcription termination factor Rho [Marmoricola sp.]|nr:transcription termination factor Rho [Marmoricola sp.]
MTETTDTSAAPAATDVASKKAGGGLAGMLLPELKKVAGGLGIKATGMKKAELVAAIKAAQGGSQGGQREERAARKSEEREQPAADQANDRPERGRRNRSEEQATSERKLDENASDRAGDEQAKDEQPKDEQAERGEGGRHQSKGQQGNQNGNQAQADRQGTGNQQSNQQANQSGNQAQAGDEEGGSRRNRRRRGRDRATGTGQNPPQQQGSTNNSSNNNGGGRNRNEPDLQILEDDVLAPCAGILDVLDSYAFVRTSGYLPGTDDVYVSLSTVRKYGLRRGDAIVGQVRQPREGDRKEKFNPLVKLDSVNGGDPEAAKTRVEFSKLTPLYPSERLRMETTSTNLIGRVIDIASPIGKGQRGLIVSPAKAGKTMIMQSIANSITTNNPECHLMVVLVDERPEEVTDFERSVNGEVISSTFDRPASDHTMVAELAIERAKRLVELGHDVVVLLDGITRLGRAYNLAAPASGRILSGGVDSAALYPPKRFFGAARNIEEGGSLTILATALVETGSRMDEVIFEEFKGTGNMELRLDRKLAERRLYPSIDVNASSTRHEELLFDRSQLQQVWKLRRVLNALANEGSAAAGLELLMDKIRTTQSNDEFLAEIAKGPAT